MKKDVLIYIALLLVGFLFHAPQAEAGRLNFMLINMTEDDIVDIRISPTYAPQNSTDNLLYTHVEPNRRLYVGPNLYGQERYWNIQVRWASGLSHTFTRTRLTRYNTYLVYTTPKGVCLRQSYERVFARYRGKPACENAELASLVGFGESEKENVKESVAPVFTSFLRELTCMRGIAAATEFSCGQKGNCMNGRCVVAGIQTIGTLAFSGQHSKGSGILPSLLDKSVKGSHFAYCVAQSCSYGHTLSSLLEGETVPCARSRSSPLVPCVLSLASLHHTGRMGRSHYT